LYDTAETPLAFRAEPYKLSSEENDYTGRAEAYTMLVSSDKDHSQDFKNGIVKKTHIDKDGRLKTGVESTTKTVYGGTASRNPAIFEKHIEDWMRQKVSQRQQVDNIKLAFSAPGDSAREVGDMIWFNFLSNRPTPTDDGHKYLNGRYLITGLRHQIKSNLEYKVEGRKILTGESVVFLLYIKIDEDPNTYDTYLREAITHELAADLCYAITNNLRLD